MYNIITSPNKILIAKSKPVKSFDKKLGEILKSMEETLKATSDPIGVGLAAPQVGISLRIFQTRPAEKSKVRNFINPEIISFSNEEGIPEYTNSEKVDPDLIGVEKQKPEKSKNKLLEGCLSLPNIWGNVTRKKTITISFFNEKGEKHTETFTDFPAIIVQHEIDHLNGVLFTKHVLAQNEKLYKSHKNEKGEDEFEEITI